MPGSPQATPEGAESGGPQELLKPPAHTGWSRQEAKKEKKRVSRRAETGSL